LIAGFWILFGFVRRISPLGGRGARRGVLVTEHWDCLLPAVAGFWALVTESGGFGYL